MGAGMLDHDRLRAFFHDKNWAAAHAALDEARNRAFTADDVKDEAYWHVVTLMREQRYEEAMDLLRERAELFNRQCLVQRKIASILNKLGRNQEALAELSKAPVEEEMEAFYALALDAKFLYFYLLAKSGDRSIRKRLDEIPDDYRHFTIDGKFLTKPDIASLLNQT